MAKKAEREFGGKLEILYRQAATVGKDVFIFCLQSLSRPDMDKVVERAANNRGLTEAFGNKFRQDRIEFGGGNRTLALFAAYLDDDGKRREYSLSIVHADEDRRRFAGKYRLGETHRDIEFFQADTSGKKSDYHCRDQEREHEE